MIYRSKEQAAYAKLIAGALRPGSPLLAGGAAGLGKTHGYSIPLLASGLRVAIALSTRQLIDQFVSSDALAEANRGRQRVVMALKTRAHFETAADYQAHRAQALAADVLVLTHAAALIDSWIPGYAELRQRDVVLFDEADLLADAADLRGSFTIPEDQLRGRDCEPREAATYVMQHTDDPEIKAAASAILYALDHPTPYKVVGRDLEGNLVLKHRMPGRMLKPLVRDVARCIFTSGTLMVNGRFDYFVRALGLSGIDPASRHIDPLTHGDLNIICAESEMSPEQKAAQISQAARPALVLTSSHEDTQALGGNLPLATVRMPGEALLDALERCPDDGILIAAGAWSGLDSPRLRWRSVIIPKAPYGPPVEVDGQQLTHYLDSRVVAVRRICQGLHRGLRTPDAHCTLILQDPRCRRPELMEAIPSRFKGALISAMEGEVEAALRNERERHRPFRTLALKHYGCQCMWHEGCDVKAPYLLDVHHRDPVSEGVRRTALQDLMVLCKNHHAEAHQQMRLLIFNGGDSTKIDDGSMI